MTTKTEILDALATGEKTYKEIAAEIGKSTGTVSKHLRALKDQGRVAYGSRYQTWALAEDVADLIARDILATEGTHDAAHAYIAARRVKSTERVSWDLIIAALDRLA